MPTGPDFREGGGLSQHSGDSAVGIGEKESKQVLDQVERSRSETMKSLQNNFFFYHEIFLIRVNR